MVPATIPLIAMKLVLLLYSTTLFGTFFIHFPVLMIHPINGIQYADIIQHMKGKRTATCKLKGLVWTARKWTTNTTSENKCMKCHINK